MTRSLLTIFVSCLISLTVGAQIPGNDVTAIDAKGVAHSWRENGGKGPQWRRDLVHYVPPDYPSRDQRRSYQGTGVSRITIDPKTGGAKNVTMVRSAGHIDLDRRSLLALKQWRWKPETWTQVDVIVTFVGGGGTIYLPERNVVHIPRR